MHVVIGHKIHNEIIGAFHETVVAPIIIDHIAKLTVKPERVVIDLLPEAIDSRDEKCRSSSESFMRGSGVVDRIRKAGDEFVHQKNWRGQDVYLRNDRVVQEDKFMKKMVSRGAHLVRRLLPCNTKG